MNRGIEMTQSWEQARAQCQAALGELVEGKPKAFKALWSHADDVTIMGAFGGFERGWKNVLRRLDWASAGIGASERHVENLLTVVGQDLACTVDLEHMERTRDGRTYHRVLAALTSTDLRTGAGRSSSDMPTSCRTRIRCDVERVRRARHGCGANGRDSCAVVGSRSLAAGAMERQPLDEVFL